MNIETLQAAERVSAWYRDRMRQRHAPSPDDLDESTPQGCSSDDSAGGTDGLLRSAHITPAISSTMPASVSA